METQIDHQEVSNPERDLDTIQETETEEVQSQETSPELEKLNEIANNQRIRAEKAEAELKKLRKAPQPKEAETETPKNGNLSFKDMKSLIDLHDEDAEFLIDKANELGKSVSEMKKDPYMAAALRVRQEERATAQAASTGTTKGGTRRDSPDVLLKNFEEGKVPETDADIRKLVEAELERKRAIAKGN